MTEREIFLEALEMNTPEARAAYLQGACGRDVTLRRNVEELLKEHFSNDSLLAGPAVEGERPTAFESLIQEAPAQMIGCYKLLEKIGEGGFGEVWMAEQREPVKRRVALKIIKLGMDSRQIVARFEAERQALAMMDHPNIAKIFDAGTTEGRLSSRPDDGDKNDAAPISAGRLYFVMELVRGIKITEYCDQNQLPTRERLGLFILVCQAIQHAHQKGIIHRDIKPSNILVTLHDGAPVPKVIDFGIAKATQQQLTDKTVFTQFQQFIGTPAYISPEQAEMSGLDIDTRADIYSLGVLLYELLVGQTPFDVKEMMRGGLDALRQIIREKEPLRPSTKLNTLQGDARTTAGKRRQTDVGKLVHQLQGDLDWIVMKCLDKDRTRRYETANGLAADIQRHLANEPVVARPPSAAYKIQKAWQRNKVVFTAGATVFLALAAGLTLAALGWIQTRTQRDAAVLARAGEETQRKRAQANEERAIQERQGAELAREETRRRAYAADMLLCQQALAANNLRRARLLLERQRPAVGQEDLRGWEWRYNWQRCQGDALFKLDMRGQHPLNAMFTKDDNSVATFMLNGRVSLWDLATSQEDVVLQHEWSTGSFANNSGQLCVSADGEWIAAAGRSSEGESVIRIWDVTRRSMVSELTIGTKLINALALSPNKQWLAVYAEQASVWNVRTKQSEIQFPIPGRRSYRNRCGAVAFAPDGAVLATGDRDGRVRLVDVHNWTEKTVLPGRFLGHGVITLGYSPNGRFLAAGSAFVDPRILVWETETDKKIATLEGHGGFIAGLAFSADGKILASASADQTIKLWNTETWKEKDTLLGHNDEVWSVAFSSDGKRLISSGKDGYLRVWPASGKRQDRESLILPSGIQSPDVSPDGKSVVGISDEGTVRLLAAARLREKSVPQELGSNNVAAFWVSPEEILVGSQRPLQLKTWNLSHNAITTYPLNTTARDDAPRRFSPFNYFPDAHLLVAITVNPAAGNLTLSLWDALSHQELSSHTLKEPLETLQDGALSQDGAWFAMSAYKSLSIWNIRTGQKKLGLQVEIDSTQGDSTQGLALFSGRPWVVSASTAAPTVNVWDIVTGKKLTSLEGHNQVLSRIVLSPDERRLITSTIGQEPIRFWDTKSWNELLNIQGRPGCSLRDPCFLSDGHTLSAVEVDLESRVENARLWRAPSWEEIAAAEAGIRLEAR